MGKGWRACSTPHDRGCWLRKDGIDKFDITTDYETRWPKGVTRKYHLDVTKMELAPDGFKNLDGKVFNRTYPGPWIQACWGDDLEITITNYLKNNGTTIHWHGIRQLGTLEMDGVNGITQCPIATNDSFTYKFKATQYGSSWYHSHYSLQYGDGLLGPMTIYGPSSANYDEAIDPILMTDWNHRSAFTDFYQELVPGAGPPNMTSILLNGRGNYTCTEQENRDRNCTKPPEKYNVRFQRGKKYLMRLINTSVDTTFVFAIDNHNVTVVGSDFVPIRPYSTSSVLVGIGQRYHVIVEAKPINDTRPAKDQNFWIRTFVARRCGRFTTPQDEKVGILRYSPKSTALPTTTNQSFPLKCSDEPYESLVPVVPWKVGPPSNNEAADSYEAGLTIPTEANPAPHGNFSRWAIGEHPLWLNFSNPTILNLNNTDWDPELVVIPQNLKDDSWIYLLITATDIPVPTRDRNFVAAAHPIHLHGHDFAILKQSETPFPGSPVNLTLNNPPRRDVALLPAGGYIIIAFKSDNPGAWLLHCHIAWHASSGLALQILERQDEVVINPENFKETERVCRNWKRWFADTGNFWKPGDVEAFQEDSGI